MVAFGKMSDKDFQQFTVGRLSEGKSLKAVAEETGLQYHKVLNRYNNLRAKSGGSLPPLKKGKHHKTQACGLYKIECTATKQFYIGSTLRNWAQRKSEHVRYLKTGKGAKKLQAAWDKYGAKSFVFVWLGNEPAVEKLLAAGQGKRADELLKRKEAQEMTQHDDKELLNTKDEQFRLQRRYSDRVKTQNCDMWQYAQVIHELGGAKKIKKLITQADMIMPKINRLGGLENIKRMLPMLQQWAQKLVA